MYTCYQVQTTYVHTHVLLMTTCPRNIKRLTRNLDFSFCIWKQASTLVFGLHFMYAVVCYILFNWIQAFYAYISRSLKISTQTKRVRQAHASQA